MCILFAGLDRLYPPYHLVGESKHVATPFKMHWRRKCNVPASRTMFGDRHYCKNGATLSNTSSQRSVAQSAELSRSKSHFHVVGCHDLATLRRGELCLVLGSVGPSSLLSLS